MRTAKAAERTERTTIPVYLEGVVKDRLELAELTKDDNGSRVHLAASAADNGGDDKKIPLKEQLQDDPYVQLAVSLMNELALSPQGIKTSQ
jgi:hypothetical protein